MAAGLRVSAVLSDRYVSREEYRAWCERQAGRYERVEGRIVAMSAERIDHVRIKAAAHQALQRAIAAAGVGCEALADGVTVETGDSDYEPDALVNGGAPLDGDAVAATNPVVIVEVLSPGTASVDTGGKLAGYFRLPCVAHYLIVHPVLRVVIHHQRDAAGIGTRIVAAGPIVMEPPGITVAVEEILGPGA